MLREAVTRCDEPLNGDAVSASWPGSATRVVLGSYEGVKAMMQDFLDQSALGERLTKRAAR